MANLRFVDGAGDDAKYRKASGVGSDADPFITDVSVSSIAPGTAASSLGKAEDAAHSSGDVGVYALTVRRDTAAATAGTDGDYQGLATDANGRLHVIEPSASAALTALQLIDDAVKTDDAAFTPATDKVLMIGAEADETGPDSVDEGDAGALRMTLTRALHVNLRDSAGAEVSVGGGTQYDEDAASAGAEKVTMAGVVRRDTAASSSGTDGDISTLCADANGRLHVNAGTVTVASHAVTNAGTFAVQVDGAALTSLQLLDDAVKTDDAAFTPATDKVLMVGAQADETAPDSVNEGDAGALRMTLDRLLRVVAEMETATMRAGTTTVTPAFAIIDAATSGDNTIVTNPNAGQKIRVFALFMVAAGTVTARFESDAGGTAKTGQMNLVANSGFVLPFCPVGWFETAADADLNLELSGAVSVDGAVVYGLI